MAEQQEQGGRRRAVSLRGFGADGQAAAEGTGHPATGMELHQPGQGEQRADRVGAKAGSTRSPDGAGRRSKPSPAPGRGGEGITRLGEERCESTRAWPGTFEG